LGGCHGRLSLCGHGMVGIDGRLVDCHGSGSWNGWICWEIGRMSWVSCKNQTFIKNYMKKSL